MTYPYEEFGDPIANARDAYRDETIELRAIIKMAHYALTKSSLTAEERVHDATRMLSTAIWPSLAGEKRGT